MDYVYGGLAWHIENPSYYIFNYPVYEAINSSEQYIFIESISKRIFLNGAKFALVFSSENLMRRILRLSVFMVGSMALQQVKLVPQIYSTSSEDALIDLIKKNAIIASNRYQIVKNLLAETNIELSSAGCGYFALMFVPTSNLKDDIEYSIDILNKTGVLTTPHSRYLLKEKDRYSFRINLLLDKNSLIKGITKIIDLQ